MAKYNSIKDFEKAIEEKLNRTGGQRVSPLEKLKQIAQARRPVQ